MEVGETASLAHCRHTAWRVGMVGLPEQGNPSGSARLPMPPLIENTIQWLVTVIDSADGPYGREDMVDPALVATMKVPSPTACTVRLSLRVVSM